MCNHFILLLGVLSNGFHGSFFHDSKLECPGTTSMLNLYCVMKVSTKSLHL
jgi:hypothetical protein